MRVVTLVLLGVMALEHVYFLYLQMFRWTHPRTVKAFKTTAEVAYGSKKLASNQGLYNGFLAAGLVWGLWLGAAGTSVKVFFLACVVVAGVYGAATVGKKILFVQALPAAIALALLLAG